jgi:hypothetical protein
MSRPRALAGGYLHCGCLRRASRLSTNATLLFLPATPAPVCASMAVSILYNATACRNIAPGRTCAVSCSKYANLLAPPANTSYLCVYSTTTGMLDVWVTVVQWPNRAKVSCEKGHVSLVKHAFQDCWLLF